MKKKRAQNGAAMGKPHHYMPHEAALPCRFGDPLHPLPQAQPCLTPAARLLRPQLPRPYRSPCLPAANSAPRPKGCRPCAAGKKGRVFSGTPRRRSAPSSPPRGRLPASRRTQRGWAALNWGHVMPWGAVAGGYVRDFLARLQPAACAKGSPGGDACPRTRPRAKPRARVARDGMQRARQGSAGSSGWGGVCRWESRCFWGREQLSAYIHLPTSSLLWHSREVPDRAATPATGCPRSWGSTPSSLPGHGHRVGRVRAPLRGVARRPGFPPDEHKDQPR